MLQMVKLKMPSFRKESIDSNDYILRILGELLGFIDCEKHVGSLIQHQEKLNGEIGAWSETFKFNRGNEAALTTAEAILALLDSSQKNDSSNAIKRACNYLVQSQTEEGGWKDLSTYPVNDATGCALAALSGAEQRNILKIPEKTLRGDVNYLVAQQNGDGGWSTVKGEKSKMHYTFFALWGLATFSLLPIDYAQVTESVGKGTQWILKNSKKNNDKGVSISIDDGPSPTATALAILCLFNIRKKNLVKPGWKEYLKTSRKNGVWDEISDSSMVHGVRRVYDFRSLPWIIEALVRTGEHLDSEVIQEALKRHKKFEIQNGGFVSDVGKTDPVVWHTVWSIIMMQSLSQMLRDNLKFYIDKSLKNSLEMAKRIKIYEKAIQPEKKVMQVFWVFSLLLSALAVYLLRLVTTPSYGRFIWYPSAIGSSLVFAVAAYYYLYERGRLNKLNAALISLIISVVNLLLGLIP